MFSTEVSVEKMLFELGWSGVPLVTVTAEMLWLYVAASLDTAAVVRRVGVIGEGGDGMDDCVLVIGIFLDEALRSGRLECLHRPGAREPQEVLDALARLRGDGGI